jgi:uncharacterized protein (TIRG00374 family)
MGQSKWLRNFAKLALTLLTFAYAFSIVDVAQLSQTFAAQDHIWLTGAALLIAVQIILGAARWWLIVMALSDNDKKALSWPSALKFYYISIFFNCCLPGTVGGDVVRVWLAKSDNVPLSHSISSVIIDRIIALLALVVLILAILPLLSKVMGFTAWPVWLAAGAVALLAACFLGFYDRLFARFERFRVVQWVRHFLDLFLMLARHKAQGALTLVFALASHLMFCACAYILAHSMNVELSLLHSIMLVPPILLATTIPISIGGWGVREVGLVALLGLVGVPKEAALMIGIQLGLITMIASLPAGLLWLLQRNRKN